MDDDVESHELPEGLVGEAEHLGEVGTIVEGRVSIGDVVLVLVAVVEDDGSDARDASAHIESIFVGAAPVLALVDTVVVGLGELGGGLASENTH